MTHADLEDPTTTGTCRIASQHHCTAPKPKMSPETRDPREDSRSGWGRCPQTPAPAAGQIPCESAEMRAPSIQRRHCDPAARSRSSSVHLKDRNQGISSGSRATDHLRMQPARLTLKTSSASSADDDRRWGKPK